MFAICRGILIAPEGAINRPHGSLVEDPQEQIAARVRRPKDRLQPGLHVNEDRIDEGVLDALGQASDEGWFAGGDVPFDLVRRVVHGLQTSAVTRAREPGKWVE